MLVTTLLAACSQTVPPPQDNANSNVNLPVVVDDNNQSDRGSAYPGQAAPGSGQSIAGYPAPGSNTLDLGRNSAAYPGPGSEAVNLDQPRFQFDTDLTAGMTTVIGQAPPNLPLAVVDVSFNGVVLGTGRTDQTGRFSIGVQPLPEGHRIGLAIADLQGRTLEQMAEELYPYRGDNFMSLPNVGIFFETTMVQP
jgi:hypothetical protein